MGAPCLGTPANPTDHLNFDNSKTEKTTKMPAILINGIQGLNKAADHFKVCVMFLSFLHSSCSLHSLPLQLKNPLAAV